MTPAPGRSGTHEDHPIAAGTRGHGAQFGRYRARRCRRECGTSRGNHHGAPPASPRTRTAAADSRYGSVGNVVKTNSATAVATLCGRRCSARSAPGENATSHELSRLSHVRPRRCLTSSADTVLPAAKSASACQIFSHAGCPQSMQRLVQRFEVISRHDHRGHPAMPGDLDDLVGSLGLIDIG